MPIQLDTSADWVSAYIGVPFADQGLTRDGCNCWGLVRLVLSEQRGLSELPAYAEHSAADLAAAARCFIGERASGRWIKVEQPRAFDVALMSAMDDGPRPRVFAGHCGVMVNSDTVLHVWQATRAVQMPTTHIRIRNRIIGYFRHRELQ